MTTLSAKRAGWNQNALTGGVLWIVYVLFAGIPHSPESTAGAFVLLGSLAAVPLALGLVEGSVARGQGRGRWVLCRWLQVPCALALAVAFLLPPGSLAGVLSLPWLAFTALVALLGVLRFVERGGGPVREIAVDAGLVYLVIGGMWTCASRSGSGFLGFVEPWVVLTGVHFHFAGLVLPIVTGLVSRRVGGDVARLACFGVVVGVPLVAVGITAGARGLQVVEWMAATWLMLACLVTAGLCGMASLSETQVRARILMGSSGLCLLASMGLVGVYASGGLVGEAWLGIPEMVVSHGVLNVFGFAFPALLALGGRQWQEEVAGMEVLVPLLGDVPAEGVWESRPYIGLEDGAGLTVDTYERSLPDEEPGLPEEGGPFERVAEAILSYQAFPRGELRGILARTPVEVGDTLRGRYHLGFGLDLVFAARVVAVIDDDLDGILRSGFVYETLAGHPLSGEETFCVEKDYRSGKTTVRITARSRTRTWVASMVRPLVRRLQRRAGSAAVEHLEAIARASR